MSVPSFGPLHHVGVAVRDIGRTIELFSALFGATPESEIVHDPNQGVRIQFIRIGDLRVELLEPAAKPSPIDGILSRGIALYHVCYEVSDLDARLAGWKGSAVSLVSAPKPAAAFGGRRVAFVMCQGLMVELIECGTGA